MDFKSIIFKVTDDGVATITLNRPQAYNSFTDEQIEEVMVAVQEAEKRSDIKVLVLTGEGKAFSAGGDASMLAAMKTSYDARYIFDRSASLVKMIYEIPKPVIAAINGVVAGAATGCVLACDIIIASDKAKFAANFVNIAFVPDGGTSYFLFKKLGHHRAAEILFEGRTLTAEESFKLGIFNRVVPHQSLYQEVYAYAQKLARGPSLTLNYIKQILRACTDKDLKTIGDLEAGAQVICWNSEDFREGISSFIEKRPPRFQGK